MEKLVSIIVPVFNSSKSVIETLTSIMNQTYKNWEAILINDASTDNSLEVIERFCGLDQRFTVINLKKNGGVSTARNQGILKAKGEYICLLDSDDYWKPEKLKVQIEFMIRKKIQFSFTGYELIDEKSIPLNKVIEVPESINYNELLKMNCIGCLTVMLDADLLKKYKFPSMGHEDYANWLIILKENKISAYGIKNSLAYYRKSRNSLSGNKFKTINWTRKIYYNHLKLGFINSLFRTVIFSINTSLKYIK